MEWFCHQFNSTNGLCCFVMKSICQTWTDTVLLLNLFTNLNSTLSAYMLKKLIMGPFCISHYTTCLTFQAHSVSSPTCDRWLNTAGFTELLTRHGSSLRGSSLLELVILPLIQEENLFPTGETPQLSLESNVFLATA